MSAKKETQQDLLGDESYMSEMLDVAPGFTDEERKKWPRNLVSIMDIFHAELAHLGFATKDARRIGDRLIIVLATYCGGRNFYLAKGKALEDALRDRHIHQDWEQGRTVQQLVSKYRLSLPQVYKIIDQQRALAIAARQGDFFSQDKKGNTVMSGGEAGIQNLSGK